MDDFDSIENYIFDHTIIVTHDMVIKNIRNLIKTYLEVCEPIKLLVNLRGPINTMHWLYLHYKDMLPPDHKIATDDNEYDVEEDVDVLYVDDISLSGKKSCLYYEKLLKGRKSPMSYTVISYITSRRAMNTLKVMFDTLPWSEYILPVYIFGYNMKLLSFRMDCDLLTLAKYCAVYNRKYPGVEPYPLLVEYRMPESNGVYSWLYGRYHFVTGAYLNDAKKYFNQIKSASTPK